jgi:hypothetical protein
MSTRAARWLLFAAFGLTLPLPFFMAALEIAPLARCLFLAALMGAVVAADGTGGTAPLFAAFLLAQGLAYAGALWGAAWLAARGLARAGARARGAWVGAVVAALLGLSLFEIYRTPHSSSGATASLLGILD